MTAKSLDQFVKLKKKDQKKVLVQVAREANKMQAKMMKTAQKKAR